MTLSGRNQVALVVGWSSRYAHVWIVVHLVHILVSEWSVCLENLLELSSLGAQSHTNINVHVRVSHLPRGVLGVNGFGGADVVTCSWSRAVVLGVDLRLSLSLTLRLSLLRQYGELVE